MRTIRSHACRVAVGVLAVFLLVLPAPAQDGGAKVEPGLEALNRGRALVEKDDAPGAFAAFKEAAEAGNVRAMRFVAIFYKAGHGVARDQEAAVSWTTKAAEAGDRESMVDMAFWFLDDSLGGDCAKAYGWFVKAAEAGDAPAAYYAGSLCHSGRGVAQSIDSATKWYRVAAEGGHGQGMDLLAECLAGEFGGVRNDEEASRWFRRAAECDWPGQASAMGKVGWRTFHGLGVKADPAAGVEWYRKGAKLGNPWCMSTLGDAYRTGSGIPQDYDWALYWLKKAAARDDAEATNSLGIMYKHGQGVPKNLAQARAYYLKAVELGSANAMYNRGLDFYNGNEEVPNPVVAVKWFRKAAAVGHAEARRLLGWSLCLGLGVERDPKEGMRLIEPCAAEGSADAAMMLGCLYRDGLAVPRDLERALAWTVKSWDADPQDYCMLAVWGDLAALGRRDEADRRARARLEEKKEDSWYTRLLQFQVGRRSAEEILKEAESEPTARGRSKRSAEAFYYLGRVALFDGRKEDAGTRFRRCIECGEVTFTEHWAAVAELKVLEAGLAPRPPAEK